MKRAQLAQDPKAVMDILLQGTQKTRVVAQQTMDEVRKAMHLDYV
jgi:hypothetical protein